MTEPPALTATTRCAPLSLARADQRHGTAAPVSRWLLIEQAGPWGRDGLLSSRLDHAVAAEVDRRCRAAGVRPMLIRRPGRAAPAQTSRWAVADSRLGHEGLWWGEYAEDSELIRIALDGTAGQRSQHPAYLVCTHARHDACCAIRGRPVAAAIAELRPEQTWECSHTGGDRFAANVVVLPHGLYYGTVTPADVAELIAAHEDGLVVPGLLRGRSALPMAVQAAQHHARESVGDLRLAALPPREVRRLDPSTWQIVFDHDQATVIVTVRAGTTEPLPQLTCAARARDRVVSFDLIDVQMG